VTRPLFDAGPRLFQPPSGDPATQAVASLRGYAYQLYASGLAWLALKPGEQLYLEVAKDYSVATDNALRAVEVKDTAASTVTIKSRNVLDTLESFVDLTERNPGREVQLHFLSTSSIASERDPEDRVNGEATLQYWRRAAAQGDVAPLKRALLRADLSQRLRAYIEARDDDKLRTEFVRRIHWDCGQLGLESVVAELEAGLVRYGAERFGCPATEKDKLSAAVLQNVLLTIVRPGPRRLTGDDLLSLLTSATGLWLTYQQFENLFTAATKNLAEGEASSVRAAPPTLFERESEIPLPSIVAERRSVVADVLRIVQTQGISLVTGSTGAGKTTVARLTAHLQSGVWHVLDFRGLSAEATTERLKISLGSLASLNSDGVILDDLNEIEDVHVRRALAHFLAALRRRDQLCIATAYRAPSVRAFSEVGIERSASYAVPRLSVDEVNELIVAAGGDGCTWASAVHAAGAFGHPQLVQAIISGLRLRSWSANDLHRLSTLRGSADVDAERLATRKEIVAALPAEATALMYRVSLLVGRFDRPLALALGALKPQVQNPGIQLDHLIGPWIEQLAQSHLRMSPLVDGCGCEILGPEDQESVHRSAAQHIMAGRSIDIDKANAAFLHALLGKAEHPLMKLAYGVLIADGTIRQQLSDWMTGLRLHRFDRPIYPEKSALSLLLRLAQFILIAERDEPDRVRRCWSALQEELHEADSKIKEHTEYIILAKALLLQGAAGLLDNWVDLIVRFEELSNIDPIRKELLSRTTRRTPDAPPSTAIGTFFALQILGARSVSELGATFTRLDALKQEQRALLLSDVLQSPSSLSQIVNCAWLAEHKRGVGDWPTIAEAYRRMANQAQSWGYRNLAIRCHVARAIALDEYVNDAPAAVNALSEAVGLLGEDPVLDRERAKILYRRRDHAGALHLLRTLADNSGTDGIDKAYMCREAGISAAEIGEWAEAQHWFSLAAAAASTGHSDAMKLMAVGLGADEAIAAYKAGSIAVALSGLNASLNKLGPLDPGASLRNAYCHRVIRHAILWAYGQAIEQDVVVNGEPAGMVPGMCSNPEPTDLRDLPLASIDYARYMLAQAEAATGADAGIQGALKGELGDREIPMMELPLRHAQIEHAIGQTDASAFLGLLPAWVGARIYLQEHEAELRTSGGPLNPVYGEIASATAEQSQMPIGTHAAEDAVLSFGVTAATESRPEGLTALRRQFERARTDFAGKELAELMDAGGGGDRRLSEIIAEEIYKVAHRDDLNPDELYVAGLRFAQAAKRSDFKKRLGKALGSWLRKRWTYVVNHQKFRLRCPAVTVPQLKDALTSSVEGLAFVGNVLLAAELAVSVRLSQDHRDFLKSL
jgi:hypothetical protein